MDEPDEELEKSTSSFSTYQLTTDQKKQIQKNRERAQALREQRRQSKPYDKPDSSPIKRVINTPAASTSCETLPAINLRNSHAGFMYDDDSNASGQVKMYQRVEEDVPSLPDEMTLCEECKKPFAISYLHSKFNLNVCDKCRDATGKHSLITKTEAKQRFLLQDCDFEERNGPPLPFLLKKNPHSSRWGEMKLFLFCQVEKRAYEIWGGADGLAEEQAKKIERQEKKKEKKYAQEIKALRRAIKSSLVKPEQEKSHVHSFPVGEEKYNAESDNWTKTCSECGFQVTFEKM